MTTDFRDVLAEVCSTHLGIQAEHLGKVLPGHPIDALNFRGVCRDTATA